MNSLNSLELENKNIVLDKNDFKKNSLYPYSEIPDLFDPFDENILNEINLLKNLLHYIPVSYTHLTLPTNREV